MLQILLFFCLARWSEQMNTTAVIFEVWMKSPDVWSHPPKCKKKDLFYYRNYRMSVFFRFPPHPVMSHFWHFRLKLPRQTGELRPYLARWDPERAVRAFDKVQRLAFGHEAYLRRGDISAMDQSGRTPRATRRRLCAKLKEMRQTRTSPSKKATGAH